MSLVYKLSDIDSRLQELLDLAETGKVTQEYVLEVVTQLDISSEQTINDIARAITSLTADVETIDKEVTRLVERRNSIKKFIGELKNALLDHMKLTGEVKIKTPLHTVSVAKNGGKLPLEIVEDVPEEFLLYEPKTNTEAIRKALESGQELEFARLGKRGEHLRIK